MTVPRCKSCGNKRRPLRWCPLFDSWLCVPCAERRIRRFADELDGEIE